MTETTKALKEGSRWRHERPNAEEVGAWFADQKLDEGMEAADYVSGLVLIESNPKVKRQTDKGTEEVRELVYTPYVTVNTRVRYFHALAEKRELIPVVEPVPQRLIEDEKSPFFNANMPEGYSWFGYKGELGENVRYLVATWSVALYQPQDYASMVAGKAVRAVRAGSASKQVEIDEHCIERAETGAIGRALGVAGILVVGSGIATAEDMLRVEGTNPASSVPIVDREGEVVDPVQQQAKAIERFEKARESIGGIDQLVRPFNAWWSERRTTEGWGDDLKEVPIEVLAAATRQIEAKLAEHKAHEYPLADAATA